MESTDWSAEVREALAAVAALTAALDSVAGGGADRADLSCSDQTGPSFSDRTGPSGAGPLWDDPLRDLADACLDGLGDMAQVEARFAALKVLLAAAYVRATHALAAPAVTLQDARCQEMAVTAEVACVLTVGAGTAGAFLGDCLALTNRLPLTLAALGAGTISWDHARAMVDETANLDPAGAAALEAHFLDPDAPNPARGCPAGELVPYRFRSKARTWRERHHPDSIEKRHARSAKDRRVEFRPDSDGMAWFSAYLPADTAAGIWDRTTAAARALQGPDETRTLTQLRADIAATLLLNTGPCICGGTSGSPAGGGADNGAGGCEGACGEVPVPRAQVLITVPVLSLLGATEEPAMLDGYGPIPPSMARRLVADGAGSFHRVLIDPRDGAPLEIGRNSYRLTKTMRQWLRLRDGRCPFPGCNNPSLDNDADHLLAWADGGTTGISNLGQPCRKHHRLKHASAWTPSGANKDTPPGWTSPSGRYYPSEQQDWEPPHWPPGILAAETLPDTLMDSGLPAYPGWDTDLDPPPDPFPDGHLFTAGHEFSAANMEDLPWPEPLEDHLPQWLLLLSAG
ncbi:DUF222 domain-containing protein [Pseudarthrobacter sp. PvP090]|uniref:HNH endonuclease signature motif containing protein n=1 Tax=Pseudarthrobacter sp. PvP090 TaxID=3156393 RepID=UPI00339AFF83